MNDLHSLSSLHAYCQSNGYPTEAKVLGEYVQRRLALRIEPEVPIRKAWDEALAAKRAQG